jgi:DNA-binding NtrC family response regulator
MSQRKTAPHEPAEDRTIKNMTIKLEAELDQKVVEARPSRLTFSVAAVPAWEPAWPRSLRLFRAEAEAHAISRALDCAGWNRRRAAQLLRISYRVLLYKIRQYNITARTQDEGRNLPQGQPGVEK